MKNFNLKETDKKNLPLFCHYMTYNNMISEEVEKKLFAYGKKKESVYGRHSPTRPISKIIDIEKL